MTSIQTHYNIDYLKYYKKFNNQNMFFKMCHQEFGIGIKHSRECIIYKSRSYFLFLGVCMWGEGVENWRRDSRIKFICNTFYFRFYTYSYSEIASRLISLI